MRRGTFTGSALRNETIETVASVPGRIGRARGHARSVAAPRKRSSRDIFVAISLACAFGPLGLLYAAPRGAAVLSAVGIVAGFVVPFSPTPALAVLALVWLLSIEWAAAAASSLPVLWYLRQGRSPPMGDTGTREGADATRSSHERRSHART